MKIEKVKSGSIIFGKPITGAPMEIKDITEVQGIVVIRGTIFKRKL
jgi:DNA polymerase-3 subunit alpha (Gram-positive type)